MIWKEDYVSGRFAMDPTFPWRRGSLLVQPCKHPRQPFSSVGLPFVALPHLLPRLAELSTSNDALSAAHAPLKKKSTRDARPARRTRVDECSACHAPP